MSRWLALFLAAGLLLIAGQSLAVFTEADSLALINVDPDNNYDNGARLAVSGNYMFVAATHYYTWGDWAPSLQAFDFVTTPGTLISSPSVSAGSGFMYDMTIDGGVIYVVGEFGLRFFTRSTSPQLLWSYITPSWAYHISVSGRKVCACWVHNADVVLGVLDGDPVSGWTLKGETPVATNVIGSAEGGPLTIHGQYVYYESTDSLKILRITDSGAVPVGARYFPGQQLNDVAVSGNYAYLAKADVGSSVGGLEVVDVSNPANPTFVDSVNVSASGAFSLALNGNFAYVGTQGNGFYELDISDPLSPVVTGSSGGTPVDESLDVAGNEVFTLDRTASRGYPGFIRMFTGGNVAPAFVSPQIPQDQWKLLGIPCALADSTCGTPQQLFAGDVGAAYGEPNWIVSRCHGSLVYRRFGDTPGPALIKPGLGYWFIQDVQPQVTLELAPAGPCHYDAPPNDTVTLPGEFPSGASKIMLANPFQHDFNIANMSFHDPIADSTYSFADAVAREGLNANAYTWDGTEYVSTDYTQASVVPWDGFWLIRTGANPALDVEMLASTPSKARGSTGLPAQTSAPAWRLNLGVQTADGTCRDLYNGIGGHEHSVTGYDPYDAFKLTPPSSRYVSLSFPQTIGEALAVDYREPVLTGPRQYAMDVRTVNLPGSKLVLSWPNMAEMPPTLTFTLLDGSGHSLADMRQTGQVTFLAPDAADGVTHFSVLVQTQAGNPVGTRASNGAASVAVYPNPGFSQITVSFGLAERAPVEISLYDLQGRRVALMAHGEFGAGRHDVPWNTSGRAAGTYFVRVTAGGHVSTKKIILGN